MKRKLYFVILALLAASAAYYFTQPPRVRVSITFDDGYAGQYEAAKYLESQGIRSTIYVTDLSEFEGRRMLTPAQIEELSKYHEIGWHTSSHANATDANESEFAPRYNATSFAYPHGVIGKEDLVRKHFKSARMGQWGFNVPRDCYGLQTITITSENFEWTMTYTGAAKDGWIIYAIHDVSDSPRKDIDLSWEKFKKLVGYIKSRGWEAVLIKDECR